MATQNDNPDDEDFVPFPLDAELAKIRQRFDDQMDETSRRELEALERGETDGLLVFDLDAELKKLEG